MNDACTKPPCVCATLGEAAWQRAGARAARDAQFVVDLQLRELRQHVDGDLTVRARRQREGQRLERVEQRVRADVVGRGVVVVEGGQIARGGVEVALVEHERAVDARDAVLADLLDEIDQFFRHELRIAGALDVQIAVQHALRIDFAVGIRGRLPAIVRAEHREARVGGDELHRRGGQHRLVRVDRRRAAAARRRAARRRSSTKAARARARAPSSPMRAADRRARSPSRRARPCRPSPFLPRASPSRRHCRALRRVPLRIGFRAATARICIGHMTERDAGEGRGERERGETAGHGTKNRRHGRALVLGAGMRAAPRGKRLL